MMRRAGHKKGRGIRGGLRRMSGSVYMTETMGRYFLTAQRLEWLWRPCKARMRVALPPSRSIPIIVQTPTHPRFLAHLPPDDEQSRWLSSPLLVAICPRPSSWPFVSIYSTSFPHVVCQLLPAPSWASQRRLHPLLRHRLLTHVSPLFDYCLCNHPRYPSLTPLLSFRSWSSG